MKLLWRTTRISGIFQDQSLATSRKSIFCKVEDRNTVVLLKSNISFHRWRQGIWYDKNLTLIQHLCTGHYVNVMLITIQKKYQIILFNLQPHEVDTMIIFLLQKRKLSQRRLSNLFEITYPYSQMLCSYFSSWKIFIDSGKLWHPTKQFALILEHLTDTVFCVNL